MLGHVLLGARLVGRHPSRLAEHERIAAELERLGDALPSLVLKLAGMLSPGGVHRDRGELGPWARARRARLRPARRPQPAVLPARRAGLHGRPVRYLDGDFERAEEVVTAMTPLALAIRHPPVVWWGAIVYANRRMQARDAELIPPDRAARPRGRRGQRVPLLASPRRWPAPGAWTRLAHVLDAFRADGYPVPERLTWTCSMSELAEAAEVVGDRETAALRPRPGRAATPVTSRTPVPT